MRNMRRFKQQLSIEDTIAIFKNGTSGVLALSGDDDYPYAVPISYVYADEKLIFHSAKSGHKIDAIRRNHKASFCVIDQDQIVPEKYTTCFRSAIAFGTIRILEDLEEIRAAVYILAAKYRPGHEEDREKEITGGLGNVCVFVMDIDSMTGKEAIELVREKNQP